MGTRSLTFVHDDNDAAKAPIICIYRQYDGYFDGVGDDILSFLKGTTIVNGFGGGDSSKQFNGAGDLAARLVTHYKDGNRHDIGGVYIMAPDRPDDEEYSYRIYCTVGQEPYLIATENYSGRNVAGPISDIVWPAEEDDDDGEEAALASYTPLEDDQRRALFAMFSRVFGKTDIDARRVFTQTALGKRAVTSWSTTSPFAISADEATRLLEALDAIEQTQNA